VVKQAIQLRICAVNDHPFLPMNKVKALPQLQDKAFQLPQDSVFQVFLVVGVFEAQEVKDMGIAEYQVGG
jgi:hypothetical protein